MLGTNVEEQLRVDMYLGVLQDFWSVVSPLMFSQNWKEEKEAALSKIKAGLVNLNREVSGPWALGELLTVVDFRLADFIGLLVAIYPEESDLMKKLLDIRERVYTIPQVQSYRDK